ncbi:MAG: DUF5615 family PIN-like protein [bacterium]
MKLLLDECVDQRLSREFKGHNVTTVPRMGWAGKKNGELLAIAQQQFDIFITTDHNLSFQQNLAKFNIAVFVLYAPTNRLVDLKLLVPEIVDALSATKTGQVLKFGD